MRALTAVVCGVVPALALGASACTGTPRETVTRTVVSGISTTSPSSIPTTAFLDRATTSVRTGLTSFTGRGDAAMVTLIRVGEESRVITAGFTDVARRKPVTPEDRFRIASITKSMLAAAVLEYVASGRIGLDDSVDTWLPGLLPFRQITIRHLLSHRSGLHELTEQEYAAATIRTDAELVAATVKHPLDFAPGSDGAYSNTGYVVLGLLLEKLSRKPLPAALRGAVFAPAGMQSTTLGGTPTVVPLSGGQMVENEGLDGVGMAAGGVVSTAADVDRFYGHLFAGDLIPLTLVDTMAAPTGTTPLGQGGYGLGLWIWPIPCGQGLGHSGSLYGYSSKAWTLKGVNRSVVVLVDDGQADSFANNIAQAALCP